MEKQAIQRLEVVADRVHAGLLRHDLEHPDGVGIGLPRQGVALVRVEPRQQRGVGSATGAAPCGGGDGERLAWL